MDVNSILESSEKNWKETQDFLKKVSKEERKKIEENEANLSYKE